MSTQSPDSAGNGSPGGKGLLANLDDLSIPDHGRFVDNAYRVILGRTPSPAERNAMLAGLLRGDTKTWLLGSLRYAAEGRVRGVSIPGLRVRYLAQRVFRIPGVGPVLEWLSGFARLPGSLRYLRAVRQMDAEREQRRRQADDASIHSIEENVQRLSEDLTAQRIASAALDERQQSARSAVDGLRSRQDALGSRHEAFSSRLDAGDSAINDLRARLDAVSSQLEASIKAADGLTSRFDELQVRLAAESSKLEAFGRTLDDLRTSVGAIARPTLQETLEIAGESLAELAKRRAGLPANTSIDALDPALRYTLFESVFYDSATVAAKQRVYMPYIDRELAGRLPFLDLGCGRGEFLHILREHGIRSVGVDTNPTCLVPLKAEGFDVVEQDLLTFLEHDERTYAGCAMLQVIEHLSSGQIERVLALVAQRIAPGGVFIVETPNPLSPRALGVFHTDPTHVAPLPPERLRYSIEAAGFRDARTLFQARIPDGEFAGPNPLAYYGDYAIIARRSIATRRTESNSDLMNEKGS